MPVDLAAGELVRQLRRAGRRPPERLVNNIIHAGAASIGPLLALATEVDLLHQDEPECFAPIHALRLLGEIPTTQIIDPLIAQMPIQLLYPDEELPSLWANEVPQIIGRLGAMAVEPLWAIADDESARGQMRGVALIALAYAAVAAPEIRDEVVTRLLEHLGKHDDKQLNALLILALSNLDAKDAYAQVMRMYREGKVDQSIFPAAAARQALLTPGERMLACVRHPLWERYDEHGPFETRNT